MSIEAAEKLKQELTDRYVVVADGVAELRRFAGLTGRVKTVNMSCRALVEFDGPEDIGWYDIDPSYLTVVEAPLPKKKAAAEKPKAEEPKAKAQAKPAVAAGGKKKSPLELARQQDAARKAAAEAEASAAAGTKKKLSPLEQARAQDAARKSAAQDAGEPSAAKAEPKAPAPSNGPAEGGKKLSPLERARLQDSGGGPPAAAATEKAEPEPADEPEPETDAAEPAAVEKKPAPPGNGKKLSPLELARMQDSKG